MHSTCLKFERMRQKGIERVMSTADRTLYDLSKQRVFSLPPSAKFFKQRRQLGKEKACYLLDSSFREEKSSHKDRPKVD